MEVETNSTLGGWRGEKDGEEKRVDFVCYLHKTLQTNLIIQHSTFYSLSIFFWFLNRFFFFIWPWMATEVSNWNLPAGKRNHNMWRGNTGLCLLSVPMSAPLSDAPNEVRLIIDEIISKTQSNQPSCWLSYPGGPGLGHHFIYNCICSL